MALQGKFRDWWRRNRRKILIGLGALIGGVIGAAVSAVVTIVVDNPPDEQQRTADFDLSPSETSILDRWVEQYFMPFYNALIGLLDGAISSRQSGAVFIEKVNEVNKHMAILRAYLNQQTESNYTSAMYQARRLITQEFLDILETEVINYTARHLPNTRYELEPILASETQLAYGMVYTWADSVSISYQKAVVATEDSDAVVGDESEESNSEHKPFLKSLSPLAKLLGVITIGLIIRKLVTK